MHLNINTSLAREVASPRCPPRRSWRSALPPAAATTTRLRRTAARAGGAVSGDVSLVAYSTPQEVYEESLGPTSRPATARTSSSPTRSAPRAISPARSRPAQPADVVHLALEPDMTRLVDVGARRRGLGGAASTAAVLQNSVVAFTRPRRQPEGHHRTGTTSSAMTSRWSRRTRSPRVARSWDIMAAYGQAIEQRWLRGRGAAVRRRDARQRRRFRTQARPTRWRPSSAVRATC